MSSMNTDESNGKSKKVINEIIEKTVETTNDLGITDKHPNENKMKQVISRLNKPFRKVAHASEYFVLALLFINSLKNSGIKGKRIYFFAIMLCFVYACSDEFHQLFVEGITGQFSDVIIDTAGAVIRTIVIHIIFKILNKKSKVVIINKA